MDLIERLRELDDRGYQPTTGGIGNEAAEKIERLQKIANLFARIAVRRTDGTVVIATDLDAATLHSISEVLRPKAVRAKQGG